MDWYLEAGERDGIGAVRREITAYLRRHGAPGSDLDAAALVASELLTNAVRYTAGPVWVSLEWPERHPVLRVTDLGPGFVLDPQLPVDRLEVGGWGLYLVSKVAHHLAVEARRSGGVTVEAVLPVDRAPAVRIDPPRRRVNALPALDEARPEGGFGRESFLRALVVQLAHATELAHGHVAAEAAVAQVGMDVGGQMEAEYRAARDLAGRLTPAQLAECYVRLKRAIDGGFFVIEVSGDRIVLGNDRCPFGDDAVRRAPALCRMTSSVFGGIAARNSDAGAHVLLEERIALGDPGCRVVVTLGGTTPPAPGAHEYATT